VANIRVLQFITPSGFYGAERWVLALANNVNPDAVACDLAVSDEGHGQDLSVARYFPENAGAVYKIEMKNRFDVFVIHRLSQIIRKHKIDIVHTHGYKSDIIGLIAARRTGIRCISTPHGYSGNVGWKLAAFIRLGTLILKFFDAVAPLSGELLQDMEKFSVPKEKVRLIINGVDLKEIDASKAESFAVKATPESTKKIGYIGQLIPRKGLPDLLEVYNALHSNDSSLQLEMIGDGRQRAELESIAQKLPCRESISFLGFRPDRLERLADFDLFVLTSSLEGIPRCIMEAMAVKVPVVAYDIPGVDQLITHGVTGLLAPLGDKEALEACCRKVLDNPEIAKELAENARDMIEQKYSAHRMAEQYQLLYQEVLGMNFSKKSERKGAV